MISTLAYNIKFHTLILENDEIEALKKKLEETQKAMQLIMAQVNKVSTEVRHPAENMSDTSTTRSFNNETFPESHNHMDHIESQADRENIRDDDQTNHSQSSETSKHINEKNIRTEELHQQESTNCSINQVGVIPSQNKGSHHSKTHISEKQLIDDDEETAPDYNYDDHNEHSESDSGIQQHYESMDFTSQNMYQDEAGYSYYYEDVHYDDEDDSDSDEELEEYNHTGYQISDSHLYSSIDGYTNENGERIYGYSTQALNDIISNDIDQDYEQQSSCQLTQEGNEVLQNHIGENMEV